MKIQLSADLVLFRADISLDRSRWETLLEKMCIVVSSGTWTVSPFGDEVLLRFFYKVLLLRTNRAKRAIDLPAIGLLRLSDLHSIDFYSHILEEKSIC